MGRSPRLHYPGALFHVIARGNDRRTLFPDAAAFRHFLELLGINCPRFGCSVHVYCLMTNHLHMVLEAGASSIGTMMHVLLPAYTRYFHRRFGTVGHLFYRPHRQLHCDNDRYLLALLRYIHNNPVRAGLVVKPEDWPYSSARGYLGAQDPLLVKTRVLEALGASGSGVGPYADFMQQDPKNLIVPATDLLSTLLELTAWDCGLTAEHLQGQERYPEFVRARKVFIRRAIEAGGSLKDIATTLRKSTTAIAYLVE